MTQCRWSPYKLAAGYLIVVNLDTAIEELYLFLDKLKFGAKVIKFGQGDSVCLQFKCFFSIDILRLLVPEKHEFLLLNVKGVGLLRELVNCESFP